MEHLDDRDVPQSHDSVGLLLLDHSFNPVYINSTARLVLTYAIGKDRVSVADIREMLRARMANIPDGESCLTLISGRRKYICRNLILEPVQPTQERARWAIVFERISRRRQEALRRTIEQYGLTPRERQVALFLLEGLTSKEIAERMDISANTVKNYLHFIMTKLGTSSRAGIVGCLANFIEANDSKKD